MIPEALEEKIIECKENGLYPFFVNATAGTTVYGAFDPLNEITNICKKYNIWFHVDAAWGGDLLLSPEFRWKLQGVEKANSVSWNPHKLMGSLLQCSSFFVRQNVCY
uniref:Glutamate decarboxylase n=2 Tax=Strongyloides papillosus TaxID=174720 RepID=A0A0N5C2L3_STREA